MPQVRELLTQYGTIDLLWFDAPGDCPIEYSEQMKELVHELQPKCIINERIGNELGDYKTPEQFIPIKPEGPFEVCMTMNETWGYKKNDHNWKSPKELIRGLVDIVSKGGNFLLNVGPDGEGAIPQSSVERLEAMGKWLGINGESIYGTTGSPLGRLEWGRCTTKKGKLYLHVFNWPSDGQTP